MVEDLLTAPAATDNQTPNWRDGIAEEHRNLTDRFDSVGSLAKGYAELDKSASGKTKIPTDDSTPEEVSAFYRKTGRPDTAEGYTLPTLAEGQEMDKNIFAGWAAVAHESGMSDAQFSGLAKKYVELEAQQREVEVVEFNRYREEADRKLHEDYGADYDKNIELSKRAYTEYANDDLKALLDTDKFVGLRNEPSFIDMMVQMGKKNMDDTFVRGDGQVDVKKDNYVPASPNSPTMYETMESEDGIKARAYFRNKGHVYDRKD